MPLRLNPYRTENVQIELDQAGIFVHDVPEISPTTKANADFFGHPVWGPEYFETSHRCQAFYSRWHAATGSWDGKVVVDVGCGPGNIFATLGGSPKALIGVDISYGALQIAKQVGYIPLWADAHNIPLRDGCADLVVANATIHHCDDMGKVLSEAARLVRPGGLLVTDLDPQISAWNFKGLGLFLRQYKFFIYRLIGDKSFIPKDKREARIATETHNKKPGDGISRDLYHQVLEPLSFELELYPHNHNLGQEVLAGDIGRSESRMRLSQRLSGINPDTPEAAQSFLCIARRASDA